MKEQNSGSEQYQIKELLKYRIRNGVQELLISWEGYEQNQSTWEPYRNIYPFPGLIQDYQKLKSEYENKKKPTLAKKKIGQQRSSISSQAYSNQQSKQQQYSFSKKRPKKIRKIMKAKRNSHIIRQPQDNLPQQQLQVSQKSSRLQLPSSKPIDKQQSLEQILNRCPSTKFTIKIPVFKDIPCLGQKLKRINKCFKHQNLILYEIQVDNENFPEPLILSQSYIRVLWPRQFAQYLLEKTKAQ